MAGRRGIGHRPDRLSGNRLSRAIPFSGACLLLALVAALAAAAPAKRQLNPRFLIRADKASCLLRNSARYRAIQQYPYYLFIDLCPAIQPTPDAISTLNSNVYIKERKPMAGLPVRAVMRLTKEELACLLTEIGKKQNVRPGTRYLLIDLTRC
jgi:hypothetical protein